MLVFIDESGDPGFKVERGSSPIFVAAMVIFEDSSAAQVTENAVRQLAKDLNIRPEFKFSKSSADVRDAFFDCVSDKPFKVRAIVVRKAVIYSPHLKTDKEDFYRFFVRQMMTYDGGVLDDARVVIDGSGDRVFRKKLRSALRRQVGPHITSLKFGKSHSDPLVQLADMCVGAIARSYRKDRKDPGRWRRMLRRRMDDIWIFR